MVKMAGCLDSKMSSWDVEGGDVAEEGLPYSMAGACKLKKAVSFHGPRKAWTNSVSEKFPVDFNIKRQHIPYRESRLLGVAVRRERSDTITHG